MLCWRARAEAFGRPCSCAEGAGRWWDGSRQRQSVPDRTSDQTGSGSAEFLLCHLVSLLRGECCSHPRAQLELINLIFTRSSKENRPGGRVGAGEGRAELPGVRVTQGGYATRATHVLRWPRGHGAGRAAVWPQDGLRRSERLR